MKIFPTLDKNHKLKICICGESNKTISVNKNQYYKSVMFIFIGTLGLVLVAVLLPPYLAEGKTISVWLWAELAVGISIVGYMVWRSLKLVKEGHSIVCAIRRTIIDFAS